MITPVIRMLAHKNQCPLPLFGLSHGTSSLLQSNARTPGILVVTVVYQAFVSFSMASMPSTCHTSTLPPRVGTWYIFDTTHSCFVDLSYSRFDFFVLLAFAYWLLNCHPIDWLVRLACSYCHSDRLASYVERCRNPDFGRTVLYYR